LRQAFEILLKRPDKLMLVTGELWPCQERKVSEEEGEGPAVAGETEMVGVEHLGQYVFEMTRAKVEMVRRERGLGEGAGLEVLKEEGVVGDMDDEERDGGFVGEEFEAEEVVQEDEDGDVDVDVDVDVE
jgi:intron-binding protein aquarius